MQYVPNIKPKSLAFVTTNKCTVACRNCCFNCSPKNNKRLKLKNILAIIGQVVEDFSFCRIVYLHRRRMYFA